MEKCDICQKSFKARKNMLQHIRQIHQKNTQASCDQCSRIFTRNVDLRRHLKRCKGEKPSSSTSSGVKRNLPLSDKANKIVKTSHISQHHVICSICSIGFTSKKLRDEHVSSVHSIKPIEIYNQYIPSLVSGDETTMQCIEHSLQMYQCK